MKKFNPIWIVIAALLLLCAALIFVGVRYYLITHIHAPLEADAVGEWFELEPEYAVCGDGSQVVTQMRIGTENKVIVFFYGGGISINEYMAARPYIGTSMNMETGFYDPNTETQIPEYCNVGIGDDSETNPFRDWTLIVIPYTTADFHVGNANYQYLNTDREDAVLYHHGYKNYRAIMDEASKYLSQPDELLIAGYSAGGYGAAMLAEDLMENYFPEAGHVTLCVDSSLLIINDWSKVFREVWNAPKKLTEKIKSNNLIVDFMADLYETYGDKLTYLYIGSVRDGALTKYQIYFNTGRYLASNQNVWVYTNYLRVMVNRLQNEVPTVGIYLFDSLPFSIWPNQLRLTQHTILETTNVFRELTDDQSVIQWLEDAINGNVTSLGLDLL